MMYVSVLNVSTLVPLSLVGTIAGVSHGRVDASRRRALSCWKLGHTSALAHVSATWHVGGISRACSHQLVRHRLASFCQLSQRHNRVDTSSDDWYVTPPSMGGDAGYRDAMRRAGDAYAAALAAGARPEDARYLLPEGTKTAVNVTMNLREFASFYGLRANRAAQWEIRDLARTMAAALASQSAEWRDVVDCVCADVMGEF